MTGVCGMHRCAWVRETPVRTNTIPRNKVEGHFLPILSKMCGSIYNIWIHNICVTLFSEDAPGCFEANREREV